LGIPGQENAYLDLFTVENDMMEKFTEEEKKREVGQEKVLEDKKSGHWRSSMNQLSALD
jgi:hypothetical protein